jgi:hypothetical protein
VPAQAQGLVATVETDPLRRDAVEIEHVQRGDGRGRLAVAIDQLEGRVVCGDPPCIGGGDVGGGCLVLTA